jgi:hypothetical protein
MRGESDAPGPVVVTEEAKPRTVPSYLLNKERETTYLDTDYGKCLHGQGVKNLAGAGCPRW